MSTTAQMVMDLVYQVSVQDGVGMGVAKARFAGEAIMSVPSLERLMRGEKASPQHKQGILSAASARRLKFSKDKLFSTRANEKSTRAS